jgi:hypothetical protein
MTAMSISRRRAVIPGALQGGTTLALPPLVDSSLQDLWTDGHAAQRAAEAWCLGGFVF